MNNVTLQPLPHGWEWTKIENLYYVVGGGTPSTKKEDYWKGDIPWISSADIYGVIDIRPRKKITQEAIDNSATNLVPAGSIVVVTRVGLGKVAKTTYPLCFSQDSQGLIAKKNSINIDYALYYLSTAVQSFKYQSRGTTISGVTKKQLKNVPFPLAPLPEQQRIVAKIEELFTQLDAAEAALKRAKANLKRYRQSVLQAAVTGELTREWREAHAGQLEPAAVLLERIRAERKARWAAELSARGKDPLKEKYIEPQGPDVSALPGLPEGWVWTTVENVSYLIQYGTSEKANQDNSGIPIIRMGNIQEGELDLHDLKYLPDDTPSMDQLILDPGDVLFNRTNSAELVGKTAVYQEGHPRATFASYLIRIKLFKQYSPDLLSVVTNSYFGREYISSVVSQQVGQANVNGKKYSKMPIPLPSFEEQKEIIQGCSQIMSQIVQFDKSISINLERINHLRQSILQRAFSGQLVC